MSTAAWLWQNDVHATESVKIRRGFMIERAKQSHIKTKERNSAGQNQLKEDNQVFHCEERRSARVGIESPTTQPNNAQQTQRRVGGLGVGVADQSSRREAQPRPMSHVCEDCHVPHHADERRARGHAGQELLRLVMRKQPAQRSRSAASARQIGRRCFPRNCGGSGCARFREMTKHCLRRLWITNSTPCHRP